MYYCSFVSIQYIICECGEAFENEELLGEHLVKDHHNPTSIAVGKRVVRKEIKAIKSSSSTERRIIKNVPVAIGSIKKPFTPIKIIKKPIKNVLVIKQDPEETPSFVDEDSLEITLKRELDEQLEVKPDVVITEVTPDSENCKDSLEINVKERLEVEVDVKPDVVITEVTPGCEGIGDQIEDEAYSMSFDCEICFSSFESRKALQLHQQRVHLALFAKPNDEKKKKNTRLIVCEVCGKKYASNAALGYHQRTHTGEKPYRCSVCPKSFTMPMFLQIHMRTHTGERPYKCPHCPKDFSNRAALNRHNRVHTGVKPYACPECGKTFTQSNSMKLHVRTVHLKLPAPYKSKRKARVAPAQEQEPEVFLYEADNAEEELMKEEVVYEMDIASDGEILQ